MHEYLTNDNRWILSPVDLSYAATSGNSLNCIDPGKITAEDLHQINILTDPTTCRILNMHSEPDAWAEGGDTDPKNETAYYENYCCMIDGKIMIRNGNQYTPLETFTKSANKAELALVLSQVSIQAALAHMQLTSHPVSA